MKEKRKRSSTSLKGIATTEGKTTAWVKDKRQNYLRGPWIVSSNQCIIEAHKMDKLFMNLF